MSLSENEKDAIKKLTDAIITADRKIIKTDTPINGATILEINDKKFAQTDFNYLKSALRKQQNGEVNIADYSFSLDNIDGNFKLKINITGGKRNRGYLIEMTPPEGFNFPKNEENSDVGQIQGEIAGQIDQQRRNDNPEDRMHIAAHVALLVNLRCYSVSQQKTGVRSRDDNPDIVGAYLVGSTASPNSLSWGNRQLPKITHFVGAEVKTTLASEGAIYAAIREARHNTRYFDRGYLIATIERKLRRYALRMAEEYDVGLIIVDESAPWRSQILHQCPLRIDNGQIHDFASRNYVETTFKVLEEMQTALKNGKGVDDDLRMALTISLSDQELWSMIPRLPERIRQNLQNKNGGETENTVMKAFAEIVFGLLLDAYEESEYDNFSDFVGYYDIINSQAHHSIINKDSFRRHLNIVRDEWNRGIEKMTQEIVFNGDMPFAQNE